MSISSAFLPLLILGLIILFFLFAGVLVLIVVLSQMRQTSARGFIVAPIADDDSSTLFLTNQPLLHSTADDPVSVLPVHDWQDRHHPTNPDPSSIQYSTASESVTVDSTTNSSDTGSSASSDSGSSSTSDSGSSSSGGSCD